MADRLTRSDRRRLMQRVRRKNTKPENVLAGHLSRLRVRFRRHFAELPGTPDFYVPSLRLVVFVNGCFWHAHQACRHGRHKAKTNRGFWQQKLARNRRRDRRVTDRLRAMGFSVYTVWECEIKRCGIPKRLVTRVRAKQRPGSRQ